MIFLLFLLFLVFCYFLWQKWELTKFQVTEYQVSSPKLTFPANVAVIADLHGFSYGKGNERLLRQVRALSPQAILIPGDMLVSKYPATYASALSTLRGLAEIAPVYYSFGNHESRLRDPETINHPLFLQYQKEVRALGVTILETESREIALGGNRVMLSALELELGYYQKGRLTPLEPGYMEKRLKLGHPELFQILQILRKRVTVPYGNTILTASSKCHSPYRLVWHGTAPGTATSAKACTELLQKRSRMERRIP